MECSRVKWIDVESGFGDEKIKNLVWNGNELCVVVEKENLNGESVSMRSEIMEVVWKPFLRVEKVKNCRGAVCKVKKLGAGRYKVWSVVEECKILISEI